MNRDADGTLHCPICKKSGYRNLIRHMSSAHKLKSAEYREMYPDAVWYTDECRSGFSKGATEMLKVRDHRSVAMKAVATKKSKDPEYFSKWAKSLWDDPVYRANKIEQVRGQHQDGLTEILMKSHQRYKYNSLCMRSTWEVRLAKYLDESSVEWKYEEVIVPYELDGSIHKYFTDFYLPQYNLVLEVKPQCFVSATDVQAKKLACENLGYSFQFITERELEELGI